MVDATRIDEIFSLGDDQKANQFQIIFTPNIPGSPGFDTTKIAMRIDQSFDIPNVIVGEYEFYYRGIKNVRPSRLEETDKHLPLQIRIDQKWEVFDALKKWRDLVFNAQKSTSSSINDIVTNGVIQALDGNNESRMDIRLNKLILKEFQVSTFDPASNDPTRAICNFIFGDLIFEKK